jgi:hypothetical protein
MPVRGHFSPLFFINKTIAIIKKVQKWLLELANFTKEVFAGVWVKNDFFTI